MATKIRLKRLGKIRAPQYRIVVADAHAKRDGKVIEEIGIYHPKEDPSRIEVNSERARYWLSVGAQPTEPVLKLLKLTGDWQAHRGKPTENRVKVAPPKPDRKAAYEAQVKSSLEQETEKVTKKAKQEKKPAKAESSSEQPTES